MIAEDQKDGAKYAALKARQTALRIRARTTIGSFLVLGSFLLGKYVLDWDSMGNATMRHANNLLFGVGVAVIVVSLILTYVLDYFSKRTLRKVGMGDPAINELWTLSAEEIEHRLPVAS